MNPAASHTASNRSGLTAASPTGSGTGLSTSLEACDEFAPLDAGGDRPTELLETFTLLMAGHGRYVSAERMIASREYAMWQLARAHTVVDEPLRSLTATLFAYFDHPRGGDARLRP